MSERGWWQSYSSAIPEWFQAYVGLEAEAAKIHVYEAELVHGLLQTPARRGVMAATAAGRRPDARTGARAAVDLDPPVLVAAVAGVAWCCAVRCLLPGSA